MTRRPAGRRATGTAGPPPVGTPGQRVRPGRRSRAGHSLRRVHPPHGRGMVPRMKRENVDYPAGQVRATSWSDCFPASAGCGEQVYPGLGMDGPSIGESVDEGEAQPRNGHPQRRSRDRDRACPRERWCSTP